MIQGSQNTVIAPTPQALERELLPGPTVAAAHNITADQNMTLVATYNGGTLPTYRDPAEPARADCAAALGTSCPCTETYADGTAVNLSANPAAGSTFAGWSGDCTGTGPPLTMNANKAVSGTFTAGRRSNATPRPNATIASSSTPWNICCVVGTSAWDALNENVTQAQGSIPSELYLYGGAVGWSTEVALSNATLSGTPTAASKAWFYMNTAPNQRAPRGMYILGARSRA